MSVWKGCMLFVVFTLLVLLAVPASAVTITDDLDDVTHTDPDVGELFIVANKPNIDITSVSYTITGSELTLSMTVKGTIEDSDSILYSIYYGTWNETLNGIPTLTSPGIRYYMATYSNGYGRFGNRLIEPSDSPTYLPRGELTDPVSGNTFTATFEIADFDSTFEVWGATLESKLGTWMDFAVIYSGDDDDDVEPDEEDDDNEDIILPNGDDTDGDGNGDKGGGTPGFEILAFIVALAIAFIILKRKKL